ncbi:glycerophosphodiester phosphodiesterase family protein [Rubripirellula reticaptiva]|uniref:Cytoplasmic glycerophosphodiester phosphodiesterase n=1 Tax=Rubripirellula reticaptiva TaxID=2528013 RepID=A0A5C6EGN4_9BACT|nr:glycerophosphodiester phosphodiesterase family protein [Rubripirellula reticaptiva]TWU48162.1 cytoplasmic glycerophosphodiester phosphodiesterase [Rubripirellula reticaptiva]
MFYLSTLLLLLLSVATLQAQEQSPTPQATKQRIVAPQTETELKSLLHVGASSLPLVSAHRGGPNIGFPENCIATFEHTIAAGFSMLEVDPRRTVDDNFVLFHDSALPRTSNATGNLNQVTLEALQSVKLKDDRGNLTQHTIPTLDEAIAWAKGKCVLVLDTKDVSIAERLSAIEKQNAEGWVMIIAYTIASAKECYAANPDVMMEIGVTSKKKFDELDASGIPWSNVVAFVGHDSPVDTQLIAAIHDKGACCMAGTSRNLDRELLHATDQNRAQIEQQYRDLLKIGVDIIETDLPIAVMQIIQK